MVWTLAVTETVSWGILYYAFAIFLVPMQSSLGANRGQISVAFSLALLGAGAAAIPVGWWLDRHGARVLMTVGSIVAAVLVVAWSGVTSLLELYAVFTAIGVASAAVLYEPAFAVIAVWFRRERQAALLTLTVVAGFASTIFLPLTAYLVGRFGWREALVILAALMAVLTVLPHAAILRRRPSDVGFAPDGGERSQGVVPASPTAGSLGLGIALRNPALRWLIAAFFVAGLASTTIQVHLVAYLEDQGRSAGLAAAVAGSLGALSVGGRLLLSAFSRRLSLSTVTAGMLATAGVCAGIMLLVPGPLGIAVFVLATGPTFGAMTIARAGLLASYVDVGRYGRLGGLVALVLTVSRVAAPATAGALRTLTGSYVVVIVIVGVCMIAAALLLVIAERSAATQRIGGSHLVESAASFSQ
ncbi:MAG: MFS transporter [Candidatus Dormibacteria bacterium]